MDNLFYKTKKEIEGWLNNYNIKNYKLIKNEKYGYIVNVNGDVNLFELKIGYIPIKFNKVTGYFNCVWNNLTTLSFAPEIVLGDFNCSLNKLTSLQFCPQKVGGNFDCAYNRLSSLIFCPKKIGGDFNCSNNQLINLDFFPKEVGSNLVCLGGNGALGALQSNVNFNDLYGVHMDCVKQIEYGNLNSMVETNKFIKENRI